jgi:leucyl aminopeptidase
MKLKLKQSKISFEATKATSDGLVIEFVFEDEIEAKFADITDGKADLYDDITSAGSVTLHGNNVLVGLGDAAKINKNTMANTAVSLAKFIAAKKAKQINFVFHDQLPELLDCEYSELVERFLVDFGNGLYYFDDFKSARKPLSLTKINVVTSHNLKSTLHDVVAILDGYYQVRDLANNPGNVATPTYLAKTAESFAKINDKVKVTILDKKDITKLGMNAFLGVAKGSVEEPKFLVMEYNGGKKDAKPIVLVGKGITFDSGGISIKPGANMDGMKYDMCGAATVIGAFETIAKLELKVNLVVLVAACENMPSGTAQKPGDIVKTMDGKTVEILNTDAEGRLILCDALTYAKRFNPAFVIDLATLTGACVIALGSVASGLYTNDEDLYEQILQASNTASEKVWRMPLFEEYKALLKGTHADLLNIGGWGGKAGSVTAACFLQEFVDYKWAHLDIAGVADSADAKGGTGRPFKLLIELIRNNAK